MRLDSKGHILVHVLITAVIIAVIMAAMGKLLMVRYGIYTRMQQGSQNRRTAVAGADRLLSVWATTGISCGTASSLVGYTCTRAGALPTTPPGTTDCKCCPSDIKNDAATIFIDQSVGGVMKAKLCVETPNEAGAYLGDSVPGAGYKADNSGLSGVGAGVDTTACPAITCP